MCVNKKLSNSIYLCNNLTYNLQNVLYSNKLSLHFKYFCIFKRIFMRTPAISTAVVIYIYFVD